jgi:hypothetical protein
MRPGSEKETSRLVAKAEVAREELAHLIRSEAPATQVKWAARTAHEFAVALEKTLAARKEMGKERLPHLADVKGKALKARMEMLKAADRLKATIEYGDFRPLPITDAQGLTYTTSVREIEPKSALETLIRHFTDSPEKKHEGQAVADGRADQRVMAHMQSRDARDYSVIRDRIAQDFYRAAGVREKAVAPTLGREQIAELNKYADTLPFFSTDRKEFKEAARMAEESLQPMLYTSLASGSMRLN